MRHTIPLQNRILTCLALTVVLTLALGSLGVAQTKPKGKAKTEAKSPKKGKSAADVQAVNAAADDVAVIGPFHLTLPEYERQYLKNNGGATAALSSTMKDRKDFLDLLVKYRLKVLEARDRGYDKDSSIIAELLEYRNNLAVPYLQERALVDPRVITLYNRRLSEVHVAHIVISIPSDSTGKPDTTAAYAEAVRILDLAKKGERFDSLAARFSADPATAKKGGDLGYFTAGMTAPGFDEAVYELAPGQLSSHPQRTPYGYHIIKLLEKIPSREVEISHILVRFDPNKPADTTAAFAKAMSILDSLKKGVDFKELAMRNSEDPYSGSKGGDLGYGRRRRFVPEFENVAFTLKPGEYVGPVHTQFGYHIIKVTGERQPPTYETAKQEMKDLYRKYGFNEDKVAYTAEIMRKHDVKTNAATIEKLAASLDTTSTTSVNGWQGKIPDAVMQLPMITLNDHSVSVGDAIKAILRNRDLLSKPLNRASLTEIAGILAEKEAWQSETATLEQQYPEFSDLMQEYQEGVLLFRAEQEEVWNKVAVTDPTLKAYWEQHRSDYQWPDRVRFTEIFVTNDSLANVILDSLRGGADFSVLAERYTQRSGYKEKKGDWGLQGKETNELSKKAWTLPIGFVEGPMKFQFGFSIFKVTEKENAREKTFDEAASEASSKFQEFESKRLEKEWVEKLKAKFGVTLHEQLLEQAFKNLK